MFVYVHSCFAERCILATACMVGTPTATAVGGAMVSPIWPALTSCAAEQRRRRSPLCHFSERVHANADAADRFGLCA